MTVTTTRALLALTIGLALGALSGIPGAAATAPTRAGAIPAPGGWCTGSSAGGLYNGSLVVDGPLAYAPANRTLVYAYSIQWVETNRTTGAFVKAWCSAENNTVSTTSNGTFSFSIWTPIPPCTAFHTGQNCTVATGEYGPISVGPLASPPAGYEVRTSLSGSTFRVALVEDLATLRLVPGAPVVATSVNAPSRLLAKPLAADGTPSPIDPTYAWNLTGTGWVLEGDPSAPNVTVVALPGAGPATASVRAQAFVGGTLYSTPSVATTLEAIPTAVTETDLSTLTPDVGGAVDIRINGSGAAGFAYRATVSPGLGVPARTTPCLTSSLALGTISVACNLTVEYPVTGSAEPEVRLSNGYSFALEALPTITVAPPPSVVAASSTAGVAGAPFPLTLSVRPGTGTLPYAEACLAAARNVSCRTGAGPSWSFAPVFPTAGTYPVEGWVVDADGDNVSIGLDLTVVAPLVLQPIGAPSPALSAEAPTPLTAAFSGGDFPLSFWWNVSGDAVPIASGSLDLPGWLNTTWVPLVAGNETVALSVRDAIGETVQETRAFSVAPATVTAVRPSPSSGSGGLTAGLAGAFRWVASDRDGLAVPTFAGAARVVVLGSNGLPVREAWVNASGLGPLSYRDGAWSVPPAAWQSGALSLSVAIAPAGEAELLLEGVGPLSTVAPIAVGVAPLAAVPHLFDARLGLALPGANHTFWSVSDPFGNPLPGVPVVTSFSTEGGTSVSTERAATEQGACGVWINYTAQPHSAARLVVTDASGRTLLGPLVIPPLYAPPAPLPGEVVTASALAPAAAVVLGAGAWWRRRRSGARAVGVADLREFVAGRDRVVARLRRRGPSDLTELEGALAEDGPTAPLADWLASLLADGTVLARTGPDGVARFALGAGAEGPPTVLLDPSELARASARRDELLDPGRDAPSDPD